ncbi:hypothetical protein [Comamonas endophytica]|uniref:Uncharacterized protein n=1 Tax=Comamonas endophytica TaxID=2949090 RepID=A0ABY6G7Z3_9BURK|nr:MULTISPECIES: hypothetical protein [unclassified Acidovorax]MCD2514563.1 hypothetical protein [Acidovorax sp. D4N7]UYG51140.1 hypothetical protein M9799_13740 [Acidovorax sp. 5MLIR]
MILFLAIALSVLFGLGVRSAKSTEEILALFGLVFAGFWVGVVLQERFRK